jgi:hypothetical protein
MTQEDKQLLLADLCARLPYGVICDCLHDYHTKASAIDAEDSTVYYPYCDEWESIEYCKPYLRPMSSMTDEEIDMMWNISENYSEAEGSSKITDLLNKWNLDHHHLIERDLAIAVTKENNPYKEKL